MSDPEPFRSSPTSARRSRRTKLMFAAFALLLFWGILEAGLRLFGFQWPTTVETMSFTFPIDEYNANSQEPFLQRDERLFWRPRPHVLGHNSRGMVGPEFTDAKAPGVFRIVCLGDSCTHFGPQSYPERLQRMLDENAPGRFEVINAGCIGYTSYQGLVLLKDVAEKWQPDLVTVYFGWNDHWLAHHYRDAEQTVRPAPLTLLHNALDRSRAYQLINLGVSRLGTQVQPMMRVELDEYERNLREMNRVCEQVGAEVWYITAAHAFDLGLPPYLLTSGEVANPLGLVDLHESYNDVVREVASELNRECVDLAHEVDGLYKRKLFMDDHIHLSETGREYAAQRLFETLRDAGLLPAAAPPKISMLATTSSTEFRCRFVVDRAIRSRPPLCTAWR